MKNKKSAPSKKMPMPFEKGGKKSGGKSKKPC